MDEIQLTTNWHVKVGVAIPRGQTLSRTANAREWQGRHVGIVGLLDGARDDDAVVAIVASAVLAVHAARLGLKWSEMQICYPFFSTQNI